MYSGVEKLFDQEGVMVEDFVNLSLEDSFCNMGLGHCDLGLSSWNSFSSKPESHSLTTATKTVTSLFIEEKKTYCKQTANSIESIKAAFLKNCSEVCENIEKMTWHISCYVQSRERELKANLQKIKNQKMKAWDRQVAICERARLLLEELDKTSSFSNTAVLDTICSFNVAKEIGVIDAGGIKFEAGDCTVLEVLQKLGRISYDVGVGRDNQSLSVIAPKFIIGSNSEKRAQFCRPWGVCTDPTGRILVSDRSNHKIKIFNESGEFILEFGKEGSQHGEFSRPAGITVDKKCRIIVADKDNHRIQVFTYSGGFLFAFGSCGGELGEFFYPWDVAANSNCDIAVSDFKNHRVQLFSDQGCLLAVFGFGKFRAGLRKLDSPRGLAFCSDDSLLVTDFNNHRVLMVNKTFTSSKVFGKEGSRPGEFFRPQGIAFDGSGKFAVADCKNYRIQVFDMNGNVCKVFGSQGSTPGQFDCPQGLCFHPNGDIIIVDLNNNRVQVF